MEYIKFCPVCIMEETISDAKPGEIPGRSDCRKCYGKGVVLTKRSEEMVKFLGSEDGEKILIWLYDKLWGSSEGETNEE